MSSFGPSPIPINPPGAVQSSFIAQHAQAPKAREKTKPQEADARPFVIKDELRLSDPLQADAVDPKPDAAEEWKHRRPRTPHRDPRLPGAPRAEGDGEGGRLDIQA
ncbi:MAG: hypothetical protein LW806_09435 [Planctomycetaceae bacterium]|jgi:hypothetical protein|nr:hypothetical protein [Planctomycetaceae bacterium]